LWRVRAVIVPAMDPASAIGYYCSNRYSKRGSLLSTEASSTGACPTRWQASAPIAAADDIAAALSPTKE